jgi:hypothetical protein
MRKNLLMMVVLTLPACGGTVIDVGTPSAGTGGSSPSSATPDPSTFDAGTSVPLSPEAAAVPTPGVPSVAWIGNTSTCPSADQPPGALTPCDVSHEGQFCEYFSKEDDRTNYNACTCFAKDASTFIWDCHQGGGIAESCQSARPANGADCTGLVDATCPYAEDNIGCTCRAAPNPLWYCAGEAKTTPISTPPAPTTLSSDTLVKDLSPGEIQTWCDWYIGVFTAPGSPPPEAHAVGADGYARGYAAGYAHGAWGSACVPEVVPASYCAQNLALSACEAPLADLNDCLLNIRTQKPSPHGCGRLLGSAGCTDLIVRAAPDTVEVNSPCYSLRVQ